MRGQRALFQWDAARLARKRSHTTRKTAFAEQTSTPAAVAQLARPPPALSEHRGHCRQRRHTCVAESEHFLADGRRPYMASRSAALRPAAAAAASTASGAAPAAAPWRRTGAAIAAATAPPSRTLRCAHSAAKTSQFSCSRSCSHARFTSADSNSDAPVHTEKSACMHQEHQQPSCTTGTAARARLRGRAVQFA